MTDFIKSLTEDQLEEWRELFDEAVDLNILLKECLRLHGIALEDDGNLEYSTPEAEWSLVDGEDGFQEFVVEIYKDPEAIKLRTEAAGISWEEDQYGELYADDFRSAEAKERYVEIMDILSRTHNPDLTVTIREDDPPPWAVGLLLGERVSRLKRELEYRDEETQKAIDKLRPLKKADSVVGEALKILVVSMEEYQDDEP